MSNIQIVLVHIPKTGGWSIRHALNIPSKYHHYSVCDYVHDFGGHVYPRCLSIAVVRHPYEQVISWWKYHTWVSQWVDLETTEFYRKYEDINVWISEGMPHHWNRYFRLPRGVTHPLDQWGYLTDSVGNIRVNHVIKYENLESRFKDLFSNYALPHLNKTDNVLTVTLTDKSKDIINRFNHRIFNKFYKENNNE